MLTFSEVLNGLKEGRRYRRTGWNGPAEMFIYLVNGSTFRVNREPLMSIFGEGVEITYRPHIDMMEAQGRAVPWLASQADLLADDWEEVA